MSNGRCVVCVKRAKVPHSSDSIAFGIPVGIHLVASAVISEHALFEVDPLSHLHGLPTGAGHESKSDDPRFSAEFSGAVIDEPGAAMATGSDECRGKTAIRLRSRYFFLAKPAMSRLRLGTFRNLVRIDFFSGA